MTWCKMFGFICPGFEISISRPNAMCGTLSSEKMTSKKFSGNISCQKLCPGYWIIHGPHCQQSPLERHSVEEQCVWNNNKLRLSFHFPLLQAPQTKICIWVMAKIFDK